MSSSLQNILVAVRIRPDERVKIPCVTSKERTVQLTAPTAEQIEAIRNRKDFYQSKILTRAHSFRNKRNSFKYDDVYGPDVSQEIIYDQLGTVALKNSMDGYNSTIFAYGQTGSGKTYSLFGPSLSCSDEMKGIIPRLCDDIFTAISIKNKEENKLTDFNNNNPTRNEEEDEEEGEIRPPPPPQDFTPKSPSQTIRKSKYGVVCSMIEIYNEKIRDLLASPKSTTTKKNKVNTTSSSSVDHKNKTKKGLELREHPKKGWFIPDLTTHETKSSKEIQKLLLRGSKNRTIAQTKMNDRSSRAHTIFQIRIIRTESYFDRSGKKALYTSDSTSLVNLVDLAGSEQMSTAVGSSNNIPSESSSSSMGGIPDPQKRKEELISINVSLSCLGLVITKLAKRESGDRSIQHIPYRNSKLTKILEDSLGGTAKTIMIATLSPHPYHFEQTLSTCRYADRVKSIKNRPVVHMDPKEKIIKELRKKIKFLQKQHQKKINMEEIEDLKTLNLNISMELELMTRKHEREKEMHFTSNSYLRHQNKMLKQKLEECFRLQKDLQKDNSEKLELIEFLKLENEQKMKLKRRKFLEMKKVNRLLKLENRTLQDNLEKTSEDSKKFEREIELLNERHQQEIMNFSKLLSLSGSGGIKREESKNGDDGKITSSSWKCKYFEMKRKVECLQQKMEMKSLIEKNEIREKQDQITEGLSKINTDMICLEKTINSIWTTSHETQGGGGGDTHFNQNCFGTSSDEDDEDDEEFMNQIKKSMIEGD